MSSASATFTAPNVTADTTLTFELTVRDNIGDTSVDTVTILVRNVNAPPVANAGPDQIVDEGFEVTLDGRGSSDPDGTIRRYFWEQIGGPLWENPRTGSSLGVAHFTAPSVPRDSVMTIRLTVTDNKGLESTDIVLVTVRNTNDPVANAGTDQTVEERATVNVNGTASADPDGTIVS